MGQKAIIRFWW